MSPLVGLRMNKARRGRTTLPGAGCATMMRLTRVRGPARRYSPGPEGKHAVPDDDAPEPPMGIDPVASRRILFGMLALVGGAVTAYSLLRAPASPPPAAIAGD